MFQATVLKACYFLNYFVHIWLLPTEQACQKFTLVEHGKWIIGARGWWQSLDVKCSTDNHLLLKIQNVWGTKNGSSLSQQYCLLFIQTQGMAESKAGTKMCGVWTSGQRSLPIHLSALFQEELPNFSFLWKLNSIQDLEGVTAFHIDYRCKTS